MSDPQNWESRCRLCNNTGLTIDGKPCACRDDKFSDKLAMVLVGFICLLVALIAGINLGK